MRADPLARAARLARACLKFGPFGALGYFRGFWVLGCVMNGPPGAFAVPLQNRDVKEFNGRGAAHKHGHHHGGAMPELVARAAMAAAVVSSSTTPPPAHP